MKHLVFLQYLTTFYITMTQTRANVNNSTIIDSKVVIRNATISGYGTDNMNNSTIGTLSANGTESLLSFNISNSTEIPIPMCHQPSSFQGNCRASIGRWSWDQSTDTCRYFVYSGCDGDDNIKDAENCFLSCGSENTDFDIEELIVDIYGEEWEMIEGAFDFRERYQQMVDELRTNGEIIIGGDWEDQWVEPAQEVEQK